MLHTNESASCSEKQIVTEFTIYLIVDQKSEIIFKVYFKIFSCFLRLAAM